MTKRYEFKYYYTNAIYDYLYLKLNMPELNLIKQVGRLMDIRKIGLFSIFLALVGVVFFFNINSQMGKRGETNKRNNKELSAFLLSQGYGIKNVQGSYIESNKNRTLVTFTGSVHEVF